MKGLTARNKGIDRILLLAVALAVCIGLTRDAGTVGERVLAATPLYIGAAAQETNSTQTDSQSSNAEGYIQSPFLDVESNLPPVTERLPLVPLVMKAGTGVQPKGLPYLELGTHGGQLWVLQPEEAAFDSLTFMLAENFLGVPGEGMQGLYGNLVEEFFVHPANTHFRLTLRKGLKWSDGTPVTTDDVAFAYEEIWQNELLNFMGLPQYLRTAGDATGTAVALEVRDDYTFYLSFDEAYGSFLSVLGGTGWYSYADLLKPAHYLKEFHPDYIGPERTKELLEERGIRYEWELYGSADCYTYEATEPKCLGFPVLWPWVPHSSSQAELTLQRNPYFHKVDGAGRQLPYIDKVNFRMGPVPNLFSADQNGLHDLYLLGYDPAAGARATTENGPGLQVNLFQGHQSTVTLFLNLTYEEETWRSIVSQPKFRQALLLGVDQELLAEQLAPGRKDHFVSPLLGYDPAAAQVLLDELGLDQVDDDGWRLAPSGSIFSLPIEFDQNEGDFARIALELEEDLQKIGLKSEVLGIDPLVLQARGRANQLRGSLGRLGYPLWESELQSDYLPNDAWGRLWRLWHDTGATKGETPPQAVQRLLELHESHSQGRAGSPETVAMAREIVQVHDENQFGLNFIGPTTPSLVNSTQLHNLPTLGLAGFALKDSELWFWGGTTE